MPLRPRVVQWSSRLVAGLWNRAGQLARLSHALFQPVELRRKRARLRLRQPGSAPPFRLPDPGRGAAKHNAGDSDPQQQCKQGYCDGQGRMRLIKGIERHHHAMPVRHGKGDENDRERYEDESRDELAQRERSFRSVTETGRLSGPSPSGKPFTRLQAHSKGAQAGSAIASRLPVRAREHG